MDPTVRTHAPRENLRRGLGLGLRKRVDAEGDQKRMADHTYCNKNKERQLRVEVRSWRWKVRGGEGEEGRSRCCTVESVCGRALCLRYPWSPWQGALRSVQS